MANSPIRLPAVAFAPLCAFMIACGAAEVTEPPVKGSLLITGVAIVLPVTNQTSPPMDILIKDDTILERSDAGTIPSDRAENHIHAEGLFALPGLIDVHAHLGDGGLGAQSEADRIGALAQFLRYGVTTLFVPGGGGGNDDQFKTWQERCKNEAFDCPRLFGSGAILTAPGSHPISTIWNLPESTDPELIYARGAETLSEDQDITPILDRKVAMGFKAIKIVIEDWGGEVPRFSTQKIEQLTRASHERNLRVFAHISLKQHAIDAVNARVDGLMHSAEEPIPDDTLRDMSRHGIFYVATLALYDGLADQARGKYSPEPYAVAGSSPRALASLETLPTAPFSPEQAAEVEANLQSNLRRAAAAGVPLALGTDVNNPTVFPGYSVHEELELMVEAGLTPAEALAAATRGGAAFLDQESELGKIAPGYSADLVILRKNPLENILNTRTIHSVIHAGRPVHEVVSSGQIP